MPLWGLVGGFTHYIFNESPHLNPSSTIDTFMSKTARLYRDSRTANAATSNLDKLNDDLHDVTRIMTKNMEELLWRGDSLDSTHFLSLPNISTAWFAFLFRNVPFINITCIWVGKVPKSGTKYKLSSNASPICPHMCCRSVGVYPSLLEVFLDVFSVFTVSGLYFIIIVFITFAFVGPFLKAYCTLSGGVRFTIS